jgi:hypothetical protein
MISTRRAISSRDRLRCSTTTGAVASAMPTAVMLDGDPGADLSATNPFWRFVSRK